MSMTSARKSLAALFVCFTALAISKPAYGIPAFARKYGLPCSACHEAWPKLNNFGQVFRDNGYQIGNERDSPIWQNPSFFPITFRITPQWHRESITRQAQDIVHDNPALGQVETNQTTHGFDLSGIDIWTAGTIYNNISFAVLPSSDATGAFHFESAFVRFDNLLGSRWLNFKFGKFELDTLLSEKRFLALSSTGGTWQTYHYLPPGDVNTFGGIGDNQLGMEVMGHSRNSYTRYSISLLSSNDGIVGLPTNHTYDAYVNLNQGFEIPRLGLQRVGVYGYFGRSPTFFLTAGGAPIAGLAGGNRSFYRAGVYGLWYVGKFDLSTFYTHGVDNVFLGNGVPADQGARLPPGAAGPTWNGGFAELHYTHSPQLILLSRYEFVRMSRQANPGIPSDRGNLNAWTFGYRYYPIMFSRGGLAWHQEYSRLLTVGTSPLTGSDQRTSSFFMGFDLDF
jgi:hypothetical protein